MIEAEKQNAENEKKRQELAQAYKRIAKTDDGKAILKDLEGFCGFRNACVNEQNPHTLQTFFALGKRRVFLRIDSMINKEIENDEK